MKRMNIVVVCSVRDLPTENQLCNVTRTSLKLFPLQTLSINSLGVNRVGDVHARHV